MRKLRNAPHPFNEIDCLLGINDETRQGAMRFPINSADHSAVGRADGEPSESCHKR